MTDQEKILAEKNELNILTGQGITFDLERVIYKRKGVFRKAFKVKDKLTFKIEEPTLSTLDRLSALQIDLDIDEKVLTGDNAIVEAKKLTKKHSSKLARIVAIAVLGQDYIKAYQKGGCVKYEFDDEKLNELTALFFHNIRPSKLLQLVVLINTISNLGDFCNSIRLLSAERTTMPNRIEEKQEA